MQKFQRKLHRENSKSLDKQRGIFSRGKGWQLCRNQSFFMRKQLPSEAVLSAFADGGRECIRTRESSPKVGPGGKPWRNRSAFRRCTLSWWPGHITRRRSPKSDREADPETWPARAAKRHCRREHCWPAGPRVRRDGHGREKPPSAESDSTAPRAGSCP